MAHPIAAEMISMKYRDLRDFLSLLEQRGELKRISQPIDPYLEMTEIADRTLRAGGPALLLRTLKVTACPCCVICLAPLSESPWGWGKKMSAPCEMLVNYWPS